VCHKFRLKFPDAPIPNMANFYNKMKRFGTPDSTLDSNRRPTRLVLTREKLYKTDGRWETSQGSSLIWLMQNMVMSALTAGNIK
jgi:hypothetical protein